MCIYFPVPLISSDLKLTRNFPTGHTLFFSIQAVTQTIKKPEIQEDEVASFLFKHISADLETMQNVLGKNKDDVFLLVHQFLFALTELHTANVIGIFMIIIH